MGQKINPNGIRLGITRPYSSVWYASTKDFPANIKSDSEVRKYLTKELKDVKAELGETESKVRGQIVKLEANIKDLEGKLDNKTRDYNKLSTTINNKDKEIKSLKNRNKELSESLDAESSKGFFAKLTGR